MDELESLKKKLARLDLLYEVGKVIHSTLDPQEALNLILVEALRLTNGTSASVILINPTTGRLEILAAQGLPENAPNLKLRLGEGITGWVAQRGLPACVEDVEKDPRYVMIRPHAKSELAVPLMEDNVVKGVLNVDSENLKAFSQDDQELLEEFAIQAARVIHNTWIYQQLVSRSGMFETLAAVTKTVNSSLSLDEVLDVVVREASILMECKVCALYMVDNTGQWLDLKADFGAGKAYLSKPRLNLSESLVGTVIRRKKPFQVENVQTSTQYQHVPVAIEEGLVSLLSVPLLYSNQVIGVLSIYKATPHIFPNEEIHVLSTFAELSAIAIEKVRLYERMVEIEEQLHQNEKLSALGLLAAEVAHEIRNPLTVIKMLFHSLNLEFPPDDPRAKDVQIMDEKMDHLNRIVERILSFARNAEPILSQVQVNELIEDLGLLTRHKLRLHGVRLHKILDPNLPTISADATQIEQAFLNLILNAVQAMPDGGELTITTRCNAASPDNQPDFLTISFKDTGLGMSQAQRDRVFSSLLSSTKRGGTGLGLAIVSRILEIHKGLLEVHSEEGQGTEILLSLPIN